MKTTINKQGINSAPNKVECLDVQIPLVVEGVNVLDLMKSLEQRVKSLEETLRRDLKQGIKDLETPLALDAVISSPPLPQHPSFTLGSTPVVAGEEEVIVSPDPPTMEKAEEALNVEIEELKKVVFEFEDGTSGSTEEPVAEEAVVLEPTDSVVAETETEEETLPSHTEESTEEEPTTSSKKPHKGKKPAKTK